MLSEREAWEVLGRLFQEDRAEVSKSGTYYVDLTFSKMFGLCHAITNLIDMGVISDKVADRMNWLISKRADVVDSVFKWPNTLEGIKARGGWARKQAVKRGE